MNETPAENAPNRPAAPRNPRRFSGWLPTACSSLERKWQRKCESAALADLALDPKPAAVQLDEALREREAESGAVFSMRTGGGLLELLEDLRMILGGDPHARVPDGDADLAIHPMRSHIDSPTFRRELHRVRQQVEQDLLHLALVRIQL